MHQQVKTYGVNCNWRSLCKSLGMRTQMPGHTQFCPASNSQWHSCHNLSTLAIKLMTIIKFAQILINSYWLYILYCADHFFVLSGVILRRLFVTTIRIPSTWTVASLELLQYCWTLHATPTVRVSQDWISSLAELNLDNLPNLDSWT